MKFGYTSEQWNIIVGMLVAFFFLCLLAAGLVTWYVQATHGVQAEACLQGCLQTAHAIAVH